ncbi:MAG: hypothetical protein AB1505_02590 [Candidatus Latescibacterota bacterium]
MSESRKGAALLLRVLPLWVCLSALGCGEGAPPQWTVVTAHEQFSLEGAHRDLACAQCHREPGLSRLASDCLACHRGDYDGTTDPDHAARQYPTACGDCHTTAAWQPATFDHEQYFPLVQGAHGRYRNTCASCHLAPTDYGQFTCTDCHAGEHQKAEMDAKHREVARYRYESGACYECHPRGREDEAGGG